MVIQSHRQVIVLCNVWISINSDKVFIFWVKFCTRQLRRFNQDVHQNLKVKVSYDSLFDLSIKPFLLTHVAANCQIKHRLYMGFRQCAMDIRIENIEKAKLTT